MDDRRGAPRLRVLVTPVARRQVLLGPEGAAACIFVTDPARFPVPSSGHVQHVFGLTAAETRVAMAMLDGKTVEMLADELCISRNTARTHLQRLFAKTGTTRQADLIRTPPQARTLRCDSTEPRAASGLLPCPCAVATVPEPDTKNHPFG